MSNGESSKGPTKRKFEEVENEVAEPASSDDDDEENLFLPQAREVFSQSRKNVVKNTGLENPSSSVGEEDKGESSDDDENYEDIDESLSEEEEGQGGSLLENEDGSSGEEVESEEETTENPTESLEELALGREAKEEDDVVRAICEAAIPQEKTKPPDLKTSCMVTDISFHPNEEIVAMSNIEGEITCYKYGNEENELLHTLNHHKKSCRVLSFNEDGSLLFSGSKDKSVVICDTETMKPVQTLQKVHNSPIYSLLCMDANIWASGDDDGVVKVWDRRRSAPKPVAEFKEMDEFVSCMITDSAARLLVCTSGEGTLTAFNTRAKKMDGQSEVYPSEMNCVGLIRQETKVLTGLGNGNMYIFDWKAFGYHSDAFGDHPSAINCMLPITDNIVITGSDDGKIRAINLFPHRFLGVVGHHKFPIERLDISTCGQFLASSSHDGRVRFWNISYFEDSTTSLLESTTKKSVRNKKRSLRKERLGFQLPSSRRRNKGDFFAGLAEPEAEAEPEADDSSESSSDSDE
uniref:WD repeat-containing protein 55 homolog n=1 Tax=Scapholeberis mucronata TaxID=202097 RepID=A0A4Y7NLI8_9CRUS|nr:EOG090X07S3 [Scapholeberis mucronata]